jgi:hypothetical protein
LSTVLVFVDVFFFPGLRESDVANTLSQLTKKQNEHATALGQQSKRKRSLDNSLRQNISSSDSDSLRSGTDGEDAELERDGDSESDASVEYLSQPPPRKQQLKVQGK